MSGLDRHGLDWGGLMRAGIAGLGLRPREFWALTPGELALMLGEPRGQALGRAGLAALMARYPDRKGHQDG